MQNKNKIKRLIKNTCACYLGDKNGVLNYCCLNDRPCVFFNSDDPLPRCGYFENGVLPTDKKLEREYLIERNEQVESQAAQPKVKCQRCGETCPVTSNRQKYCERCRKWNEKEKSKIRMRKKRQKGG